MLKYGIFLVLITHDYAFAFISNTAAHIPCSRDLTGSSAFINHYDQIRNSRTQVSFHQSLCREKLGLKSLRMVMNINTAEDGNFSTNDSSPDDKESNLISNVVETNAEFGTTLSLDTTGSPERELGSTLKPVLGTSPGLRKIFDFAIPAIGVWLCSPLLSLIDTSAVGLLSGTDHQAALNPAVAITDYAALLIAFMYTGTTNLVASSQEADRNLDDKPKAAKYLITSIKLATFVGSGLGAILLLFGKPLLTAIIGNDSISPIVFSTALKYVRIRAIGMPAAAAIGTFQAACIGLQDIKSPLYVLLAAALVNLIGDTVFVGLKHAWIGGAAGAAWATVLSQYVALALALKWLTTKSANSKSHDSSQTIFGGKVKAALSSTLEKAKKTKSTKKKSDNTPFSTRGFLQNRLKKRDILSMPSREATSDFLPYILPVTTTQVGRVSGYVAMAHVVSSSLGTASMAAQQIILSVFYCLCPIADSLNLTAQGLIPPIFAKDKSMERAASLKKTTREFVQAGAIFGLLKMVLVSFIPLLCRFFTADVNVISQVTTCVPFLMLSFVVHGIICAAEGILLGQSDLAFLGKMYGVYFFALPYFMLRVKKAALSNPGSVGLSSVWKIFTGYQFVRVALWLGRTAMLSRKATQQIKPGTKIEVLDDINILNEGIGASFTEILKTEVSTHEELIADPILVLPKNSTTF